MRDSLPGLYWVDGVSRTAQVAPSYYDAFADGTPTPLVTKLDNLPELARELWKMMFEFPVIIPCVYCESMNAVTNSNCCQCGAPMGTARTQIPGGFRLP